MMARTPLELRFYGPETTGGEIDAMRLGRSLVALTGLLRTAQARDSELRRAHLEVVVVGTDEGSFDIQILLEGLGTVWDAVRAWAVGEDGQATTNLAAMVATVLTLLTVIKSSGGQSPQQGQADAGSGGTIVLPSGVRIEMTDEVFSLFQDAIATRLARDFVETLDPSVDRVEIESVGQVVRLSEADRPAFRARAATASGDPEATPDERVTTISPEKPSLSGRGPWSVIEYGNRYTAYLEDPRFIKICQQGWAVAVTDEYRVRVETTGYLTPTGQRRARHVITEVLGYRRSPGEPLRPLPPPREDQPAIH